MTNAYRYLFSAGFTSASKPFWLYAAMYNVARNHFENSFTIIFRIMLEVLLRVISKFTPSSFQIIRSEES
ncbi:CLUMA_CG011724, isoform A [Clunio marinus]|uniref:CLUMA_CG011724, isoform A n=1 Tax=Clunio marinus TaxID=568069 RepID=A0A1J1IDM6_9DIPT|nr:CLUMA_CG011724, isoform A [Clunio marinus]